MFYDPKSLLLTMLKLRPSLTNLAFQGSALSASTLLDLQLLCDALFGTSPQWHRILPSGTFEVSANLLTYQRETKTGEVHLWYPHLRGLYYIYIYYIGLQFVIYLGPAMCQTHKSCPVWHESRNMVQQSPASQCSIPAFDFQI